MNRSREIAALLATSTVRAFGDALPPVGSEDAPLRHLAFEGRHSRIELHFYPISHWVRLK